MFITGLVMEMDEGELCLIDSGIKNLSDLPLSPQLHTLNLHCNSIHTIDNLYLLRHLRHLDLSSNQIVRIEGLEALVSLRTLNLSCNLIQVVEGLENLRYTHFYMITGNKAIISDQSFCST